MTAPRPNWITIKPEYKVWIAMKQRVYYTKNKHYKKYYADRGITVCPEWRHSFATFLRDMGPRPSDNHSLDRINNDKGYTPSNCRWALPLAQMNNRSVSRLVTFQGVTKSASMWARDIGLSKECMYMRLNKWSVERALTEPPRRWPSEREQKPAVFPVSA